MRALAISSLVLVVLLLALSSYLRLDHSGIGCEPWPDCYGRISAASTETEHGVVRDTYERLVAEAQLPMSWATPWHRLVASVLGLLIVALTVASIVQKRDRFLAFSLLLLTAFLAWLGIYSEGLQNPAVVLGNLGGGFLMLGLVAWLAMRPRVRGKENHGALRLLAAAAIAALGLQILVGGLTSANFAATACPTVPGCNGSWFPGSGVVDAFDLSAPHRVNEDGKVMPRGTERVEIHKLHRIGAVIALVLIVATGFAAVRARASHRLTGAVLAGLVLLEFAVGIAAVMSELPIVLAVAHNWLAAVLLLVLLKLLADVQGASARGGMRKNTYAR